MTGGESRGFFCTMQQKVFLRRRLLEDRMDDSWDFGTIGWLVLGMRGCEAWLRG